ncbi:MAG: DUF1592 domain-containing protein [Nannocystales bacterium]
MGHAWDRTLGIMAGLALTGCYAGSQIDAGTDGATAGPTASGESGDTADSEDTGDTDDSDLPMAECDGMVFDPGPNLARRLTVLEYGNTVQALLGVDVRTEATEQLPPELRADGFTNTSSGLITTLGHIEAYDALASVAIERIPDLAGFVGEYTSCQEFTPACESEFVERLGLRAFRRPLTEDERDALVSVFAAAQDEDESFAEGAGLVMQAMMQSPPFLYRLEDERSGDGARELGGYALATRLSYLIWAGPPDTALLDAAGNDALRTDAEIEAQVDRMLAAPEARDASEAFVDDWLNLARLNGLPRDPERFPDWTTAIADAMVDETHSFFGALVWDDVRPLMDLFVAQEAWLTPELAMHYGLEPQGEGIQRYDVSNQPERGGLLTQGSMLTIGGNESSMVARGLFVFESVLCQHPVSPPPGVDTTPPEIEPGSSQRDISEVRTTDATCAGCHLQFEPISWGLGRYLADGTFADEDHLGNALREDGFLRLPGSAEEYPYDNAGEMMTLLAEADATRECMASKTTQFAIGRALTGSDECTMEQLQTRFAQSDGTWRDLVVAIALSPGFRSVRVEE